MKKTIRITVTATYDTDLWSAIGIKADIRETFRHLEGIKVKIGAALSQSNDDSPEQSMPVSSVAAKNTNKHQGAD